MLAAPRVLVYGWRMDFTLRPATAADAESLARIHVAGWQGAYGGLVDQSFLDSLSVESRAQNWREWLGAGTTHVIIAEQNGAPAGFAGYGPLRTPPPGMSMIRPLYTAEIYALYLMPDMKRKGLGTQLMGAAAADLKARKHKSLCLWVLEGNKTAIAFYKARGGQKCGTKQIDIGGRKLPEAAFGWRDTAGLLPPVSD